MKNLIAIVLATLGLLMFSSYSQPTYSSVGEYRKAYSTLVEKWNKETNVIARFEVRQQIEQLKKDNKSLFVK